MASLLDRLPSFLLTLLLCAPCTASGCGGAAGAVGTGPAPAHGKAGATPHADDGLVPVSYTGPSLPLARERAGAPPIDLVTPDGARLALRSLSATTVVEGPLAFTELRLTFTNPEPRQVEGRFRIALPQGAAVSRFAMRIGDRWQEGEVVELRRAREAYEDFLHRKQDPALLERAAGNEFAARVFPIGASSDKDIVISYSQELAARRATLVPMRGLGDVEQVNVAITQGGQSVPFAGYQKAAYRPTEDFALDVGSVRTADALRSGDLVVARLTPPMPATPEPLQSAVVLVDTSGSRALGLARELELTARIARHVASRGGAEAPLMVAAFDQTTTPIYAGRAADFGSNEVSTVARRGALGATDLGRALRWAAQAARHSGARRVVVIGDAVATAGDTDVGSLRRHVWALRSAGVDRLDVVAVGGIRDSETIDALVAGGLPRDGTVVDGDAANAELGRLDVATASSLPVEVAGARWSYPTQLRGVQAGDQVLVYAELPAGTPLSIEVGGRSVPSPEIVAAARPLIERSWARAKIASLLAQQEGANKADIRRQIIDLSTRHRVICPYTSLLVLETEGDYRRFNIDRNALADILTIEGGQLRHLHRPAVGTPKPPVSPAPARTATTPPQAPDAATQLAQRESTARAAEGSSAGQPTEEARSPSAPLAADASGSMWGDDIGEAFGAGGLGLSGIGEGGGGRGEGIGLGEVEAVGHGAGVGRGQGFGSGHGRLGRSHRAGGPGVRMGASTVSGRLPPEIIQRIVRQRYGALRSCYEQGLARNPALQGRAVVQFVIDRSGHVQVTHTNGSTLPDADVLECAKRQFEAMTFPAPEGGIVTVTYPLVFQPEGAATDVPEPPSTAVARRRPAPHETEPGPAALQGPLAEVVKAIETGRATDALARATAWHTKEPGEVLALVALGRAYEAARQPEQAARAYGSIIDLFPWRADQRRFAGGYLEHVAWPDANELAFDSFRKAQEQRPDHPSSHRMLAMAWLKKGEPAKAFEVLQAALARRYPDGRFAGIERVLREDLAIAAAAWMRVEPTRADEIRRRLDAMSIEPSDKPSLRFVLSWETDANDVDLHVYDSVGGHAFYGDRALPSGGNLFADVTTGYGPECFAVESPSKERTSSYRLKVHYYAQGPMGFGMGKVEVLHHDGQGGLRFEERPFVVMNGGSEVDLGAVQI